MRVRFTLSIGYVPGREEIVELDDDWTNDEIEREYQDWVSEYLDGGWDRL